MPAVTQNDPSFRHSTLEAFTTALASGEPVPGGGSAAAVAAALAASLSGMVVRLSLGRPAFESHAALHREALAASDAARTRFLALADDDAAAYAAYRAARSLPRQSAAEVAAREDATRHAARRSADVPLSVVEACCGLVELVERLAGRSNPHAASDLDCAALLLDAAARAAAANVLVNLPAVGDEAFASQARGTVAARLTRVAAALASVRHVVANGQPREAEAS